MSDLGAYIKALTRSWLALLGGAILCAVGIGAYERNTGSVIGGVTYALAVAGVVLIEGGFLAFVTERHRRLALEAPSPNLASLLDGSATEANLLDLPPPSSLESKEKEPRESEAVVTPPVQPAAAGEPPAVASPALPGGRAFLDVTPKFLLELCVDKSPAEVDQLTAPYLGKWLDVMLILTQIQDYPPGNCIFVNGKASESSDDGFTLPSSQALACTFDRKIWLSHLLPRKSGDAIRLVGEVGNIGNEGLRLIRCEIPTTHHTG